MSFNTALSGLNAAANDLRITGNNIANASTTGFKRSRAEFSDVYAATLLGNGRNLIGSGVKLANVAQQFEQGTITFTNNSLDLAIDGDGFFVTSLQGSQLYTRAGNFGVNEQGFIVTNGGARLQGYNINSNGLVGGILGDLRITNDNIMPRQTSLVDSTVNLDARAPVLSRVGSTIDTLGASIGVPQVGNPGASPSVLQTSAAPLPFDYSVNTSSALAARNVTTPFNFGVNAPSTVAGQSGVTGFDFSLNTPSSLTAAAAPASFDFSNKPSAISGGANFVGFDFSGGNSATFDVSIAGSAADGTRTVTLNTNQTTLPALVGAINTQLAGIGASVRVDPTNSNRLQFVANTAGQASVLTVNGFTTNGAATPANLSGVLSGVTSGAQSVPTSFDVTVAGGTSNGTATVQLTGNITTLPALIADVRDQLSLAGLSVDVREDPVNAGRLQFFSTDNGTASTVSVGNYRTSAAGVTNTDIANVLRLQPAASSAAPSVGAIGLTGSLTRASFDVSINGGSGAGGNGTRTVVLDQNINNGDVNALVSAINGQLSGLDVIAQQDPAINGRLRFVSTVSGEPSTITVGNYVTSGIAGSSQTTANDIANVLGGIAANTSDSSGRNSRASFSISVTGSSVPSENQNRIITLDKNITTLQDLMGDIRDDLVGTGIGVDVRADPTNPGRLQFFAVRQGEASTIALNPTGAITLGNGVTVANIESALGGLTLGGGPGTGASNVSPNPAGGTNGVGAVGNRTAASFDLTLSGASANNGTVRVTLDDNIQNLNALIADIRDDLSQSGVGVDVQEDPSVPGRLQFFSVIPGEPALISINNFDTSNIGVTQANLANTLQLASGVTVPGTPSVANGYNPQTVRFTQPDGSTLSVTSAANASAAQIAAQLTSTSVPGVTADASTTATVAGASFNNASGLLRVALNGVTLTGTTLAQLASSINTTPGLGTVSAAVNSAGDLVVNDQVGNDLVFAVSGGGGADSLQVAGTQGSPITLNGAGNQAVAVGGTLQLTMDEGVTIASVTPNNHLFGPISPTAFTSFALNTFDPTNPATYNAATSVTVFDSLGNNHTMTEFFVRERDTGTNTNSWTMYVQIDGRDVGDPNPNLPPPANATPTRAAFRVQFNPDGSLNPSGTDQMLISNWVPLNADGSPNGARGPLPGLLGGSLPIAEPFTNSNFEIRLSDSTQYGSVFGVNAVNQNGYTTGRLAGVDISTDGTLFARYTNGQNQQLGQVALADFANVQGLQAVGGTAWAQTMESGEPVIGAPGSASLGLVNAGALEESNVDLSAQLVQLIIAQRNFQANARTITAHDEITQTVINI